MYVHLQSNQSIKNEKMWKNINDWTNLSINQQQIAFVLSVIEEISRVFAMVIE